MKTGWIRVVRPVLPEWLTLGLNLHGTDAPFGERVRVACPEAQICIRIRRSDAESALDGVIRLVAPVVEDRETLVGSSSIFPTMFAGGNDAV